MTERAFVDIIKDLFRSYGIAVEESPVGDRRLDFVVRSDRAKAGVEAKFYRARGVAPSTILNAAEALERTRAAAELNRGILVITARADDLTRAELSGFPGIVLYDYDIIVALLADRPELAKRFAALIQEASIGEGRADISLTRSVHPDLRADISDVRLQGPHAGRRALKGSELCRDLKTIAQAKKKNGRAFESKCEECLKYLFGDDFTSWVAQSPSAERLHRFDLIARIHSTSAFWNLLAEDFRARYVVFEFKCLSKQISQMEIYTTEKYLYVSALRAVAIIISTKGADKNASKAALGALREHGKLILNLTVDDVCKMLHAKDGDGGGGHTNAVTDDVEEPLFRVLDAMLMSIER